jgi:hypothetical protein
LFVDIALSIRIAELDTFDIPVLVVFDFFYVWAGPVIDFLYSAAAPRTWLHISSLLYSGSWPTLDLRPIPL